MLMLSAPSVGYMGGATFATASRTNVQMVSSWYDSGKRLDGSAPAAAKTTAIASGTPVSVGARGADAPQFILGAYGDDAVATLASNTYVPAGVPVGFQADRLAGSNAALTPWKFSSRASLSSEEAFGDLRALASAQNPVVGFFDPLDLSSSDFTGEGDAATVGFLRHAEMKHGRVAMAGFVGYIIHENGIRWPWALSNSLPDYSSFEGLSAPEVWDALPEASKYQIIAVIGCLEIWSENSAVLARQGTSHYMRGGKPGFFPAFKGQSLKELGVTGFDTIPEWAGPTALFPSIPHPVPLNLFDPFEFTRQLSPEERARKLNIEINNGRLAMIGLAGFISEASLPGSVPLLTGVVKPYAGDVMQPFGAFV